MESILGSMAVVPSWVHACTGLDTIALPGQLQLGLQQSQLRVVTPATALILPNATVVVLIVLLDEDETPDIGIHCE
jgi:hypothetical protein